MSELGSAPRSDFFAPRLRTDRPRYRAKSYIGAPRSMKMGTTPSPFPYDAATRPALWLARLRRPAILHYASWDSLLSIIFLSYGHQDRADASRSVRICHTSGSSPGPPRNRSRDVPKVAAAHDGRNPFHSQLWRKRVAGGEGRRSGDTLDPANPSRTHRSGPDQTIAQRQRVDPQHGPGEQHPCGPELHGRAGPHPHGMNHPAQREGDGARDH